MVALPDNFIQMLGSPGLYPLAYTVSDFQWSPDVINWQLGIYADDTTIYIYLSSKSVKYDSVNLVIALENDVKSVVN